ncbi:putative Ig domain-containing protein [Larkinella punicea]|uniref:Dystroglycan-type cadherin-like domain-containing protein n=1 Tax=Larkinella punicea TaxID=2315727 RepID=A0A368JVL7_9BACT|nr:putative Ig domain-containing protein [Larkinella punicea]RCR70623.1 hypothetical protein DUE52_06670 [Larkinella punicea]
MKTFLRIFRPNQGQRLLLGFLFLTSLTVYSQEIYYVTPGGGAVTKDGSSWANAFDGTQLQTAIEAASTYSQSNGNVDVQVWVAAGLYKPTGTADRTISFSMRNHVAVYGGFEGDENLLSERPALNLSSPSSTTLSGEIGGAGNTDNSYHVVSNSTGSLTTSAVLDGFVITAGNADHAVEDVHRVGGGMANLNASPTVRHCFFVENTAKSGGAVHNLANSGGTCSPEFIDCHFMSNTAGISDGPGGAMYNYADLGSQCRPKLTHCSFTLNSAGNGGSLFNGTNAGGTCSPVITQCQFTNNTSTGNSGVLANDGGSPTVTNCSFVGNSASRGGISVNYSIQLFTNCSFSGNSATLGGGIAYQTGGGTTFKNCIIWNNGGSQTFFNSNGSTITGTYSLFDTEVTGYGGANNLTTAVLPFVSETDLQLTPGSPAINAGDPTSTTTSSGTTDLAGNARFYNSGPIDQGAFEFQGELPTPVSGSFDGYIYGADCESFRGWAWDRDKINTVVSVDILDGDAVIATLPAGDFRQDLLDAGKGNGQHAFRYVLPESLKDNLPHLLSARVTGSGFVLKNSPKALICQNSAEPVGNQPPVPPLPTVLIAPLTAQEDVPFSATLPAFTDPEGSTLTYALSGLPAGLSLGSANRMISGTPTEPGSFLLTYSATDEPGSTNSVSFVLTVNPASTTTVTGSFDGYLDKVECGTIRGWVWDRNKPNTPVTVEFYTDDTVWGSTVANIYRDDLKNAGKGNGAHAYRFEVPVTLKGTGPHLISARVQGSTFVLKNSGKLLNCPLPVRKGAEQPENLEMIVLGNPVFGPTLGVEVRGAEGQPLRLQLTDANGRAVADWAVEAAAKVEQKTLFLGHQPAELLFLRATSGSRSATMKVLKP